MNMPKEGEVYQHYKKVVDGAPAQYKITGIAKHSETLEELVIYQPLYKSETAFWARPLACLLIRLSGEGSRS